MIKKYIFVLRILTQPSCKIACLIYHKNVKIRERLKHLQYFFKKANNI